ncbi:hypothetical protein ACFX13_021601 [Malus domestica]
MAWNNGDLPLHSGVLPPFLYSRGVHNSWIVNEALSSELRFVFDASWTVSSCYPILDFLNKSEVPNGFEDTDAGLQQK